MSAGGPLWSVGRLRWPVSVAVLVLLCGFSLPVTASAEEAEEDAEGELDATDPLEERHPLDDLDTRAIGVGDPGRAGRFEFGTYGRAALAWDLRGGTGRGLQVVATPPRTFQDFYAELDFSYRKDFRSKGSPIPVRAQFTLALNDQLFHRSGDWRSGLAVRNLFLEAQDLGGAVDLWVGSRMVRGDDIYLLDLWPLDDLNMVGGGVLLHRGRFRGQLAIGANRLSDPSQEQLVSVPVDDGVGAEEVLFLDRPRTLLAAQAEVHIGPEGAALGGKFKVHTELHALPAGERRTEDGVVEGVPADRGFVVGAQGGLWGFSRNAFANVFARFATGLAAYGPLAVPWGLSEDEQAAGARAFTLGLSFNTEHGPFGVIVGAYARLFVDADPVFYDRDDGWEGAVSVRPTLFIRRFYHQAFELSYQARAPRGVEPESGTQLEPGVFAFSVMPMLSFEEGTLSRPQFRFVYSLLVPTKGALLDLPVGDPRRAGCDPRGDCTIRPLHYLGLQAEWWFNSSTR